METRSTFGPPHHSPGRPFRAALSSPPTPPQGETPPTPLPFKDWNGQSRLAKRHFVLAAGSLYIVVIIALPLADSKRLLDDFIFKYFIGEDLVMGIIVACLAALMVYIYTIMLVFLCTREEYKTEQTALQASLIIITALGVGLLSLSVPLHSQTVKAHADILYDCPHGAHTEGMFQYFTELQAIRATPDCINKKSVDLCEGFHVKEPYTTFLRKLESKYQCVGFCQTSSSSSTNQSSAAQTEALQRERAFRALVTIGYPEKKSPSNLMGIRAHSLVGADVAAGVTTANIAATTMANNAKIAATLHQLGEEHDSLSTHAHDDENKGDDEVLGLSADERKKEEELRRKVLEESPSRLHRRLLAESSSRSQDMLSMTSFLQKGMSLVLRTNLHDQPGQVNTDRPALFSKRNLQMSCDAVTGQHVLIAGKDVSNLLFYEGLFLLLTAVVMTLLKIGLLCAEGIAAMNHAQASKSSRVHQVIL